MDRRKFCQVSVLGLLGALMEGCTSSLASLRESFTLPEPQWGDGVWTVHGHRFHSVFLMAREHGKVFFVAARLRSGSVCIAPAVSLDPRTESLVAILPQKYKGEDTRGSRVIFVSHEGDAYFGAGEYYVDTCPGPIHVPDWKHGVLLAPGQQGVQYHPLGSLSQQIVFQRWQGAHDALDAIVARSHCLQREMQKEAIAPFAKAAMVLARGLWAYASFGWAQAVEDPSMYEDQAWMDVWKSANYMYALQKVMEIFGVDLTEYWHGHLASYRAGQGEEFRNRMEWACWEDKLKPAEREAFRKCREKHFGGRFNPLKPPKKPHLGTPAEPRLPREPHLPRQPQLPSEEDLR